MGVINANFKREHEVPRWCDGTYDTYLVIFICQIRFENLRVFSVLLCEATVLHVPTSTTNEHSVTQHMFN